jgi:hypothetical protein
MQLPGIISLKSGAVIMGGTWWVIGPDDYGQPIEESLLKYAPKWIYNE